MVFYGFKHNIDQLYNAYIIYILNVATNVCRCPCYRSSCAICSNTRDSKMNEQIGMKCSERSTFMLLNQLYVEQSWSLSLAPQSGQIEHL